MEFELIKKQSEEKKERIRKLDEFAFEIDWRK